MPTTHKLQAYEVSLQAFTAVNEVLDAVPDRSGHGYLVTQCRRAVSSMVSNVAEGQGRMSHHGGAGADRLHFLRIAYGSAQEASSQLTQLMLLRLVPTSSVAQAELLLDRVRAMLWKLARSSSAQAGPVPTDRTTDRSAA